MTPEEIKELGTKVGLDVAQKLQKDIESAEERINARSVEATKGLMTASEFEAYKQEQLSLINEKLGEVEKLTEAVTEQGKKMNDLMEKRVPEHQTFEEFFKNNIAGKDGEKLAELKGKGGFIEVTASQIKAAGVTSIGNSITDMTTPPGSPYLPGIGGSELLIFDILRDPNWILDKVDMGRTNLSRLAWINETGQEGLPAEIGEGEEKPMISQTFQLETSRAKKIAAFIKITEEFEIDVPQLASMVRRMLQDRVIRAWDDAIQAAVQAVATAYSAAALNGSIPFANYWDAIYAMMAQVRVNFFTPNSVSLHPYTNVKMQADKTSTGEYLLPPYKEEIQRMLTQATKISPDNAVVGDLKQFKVDVYKEFVLKVGWVNDDFIKNQFCVLGEVRYHRYISDNRKKAIVSGNLGNITAALDGGSGS